MGLWELAMEMVLTMEDGDVVAGGTTANPAAQANTSAPPPTLSQSLGHPASVKCCLSDGGGEGRTPECLDMTYSRPVGPGRHGQTRH